MSVKQKLDALDFTLNVLREHEKMLDLYEQRLQNLVRDLERKHKIPEMPLDIVNIINLLEYRPFKTNLLNFYKNGEVEGEHVLLDLKFNVKFTLRKLDEEINDSKWVISLFEEMNDDYEYIESKEFDTESKMFAWLIRYIWNQSN